MNIYSQAQLMKHRITDPFQLGDRAAHLTHS